MIYFIENTNSKAVKIGYTAGDPEDRRRTFQTGNHDRLALMGAIPGDYAREGELHRRFAPFRINPDLEWFRGAPELRSSVRRLLWEEAPSFVVDGRKIGSIYLAGKIPGGGWRDEILGFTPNSTGRRATFDLDPYESWPLRTFPIGHHRPRYAGPYFMPLDVHRGGICNEAGTHAWPEDNENRRSPAFDAHSRCITSIRNCDLVFAWIDSTDCHGTIAEIGYAAALGKLILISGPTFRRDVWFVYHFAHRVLFADEGTPVGPRDAFLRMVQPYSFPESGPAFPGMPIEHWREAATGFHQADPLEAIHPVADVPWPPVDLEFVS